MSKSTTTALQQIVNSAAIKLAEQQYRLARYYTPFNFEPEQVDYERVAAFMDDVHRPFPEASPKLQASLETLQAYINEHRAVLSAFEAQGTEPTLTAEQLFITAAANVQSPSRARYAA